MNRINNILLDNPNETMDEKSIRRSIYYNSKKNILLNINNFNDYIYDIIENDIDDLIFLIDDDILKQNTENKITPLKSCILFNSKLCFKKILKITDRKEYLELSKLSVFLERIDILYLLINNLTIEEKYELIYFGVDKNIVFILKLLKNMLNKNLLYHAIDKYNNNDVEDALIYILNNINNEVDKTIFLRLNNCKNNKILGIVTNKFNKLIDNNIINQLYGTKIYEFIKIFSSKIINLKKIEKNYIDYVNQYEQERDNILLNLLIENKTKSIEYGINNNIFNKKNIVDVILKNNLSKYSKLYDITCIDCIKYDSVNCLIKIFDINLIEDIYLNLCKYNSKRCLDFIQKMDINIKNRNNLIYFGLKYASYDFFFKILEHGYKIENKNLKLLLKENCIDNDRKIDIFKKKIKDYNLIEVCESNNMNDINKTKLIKKLLIYINNKSITNNNGMTYSHILCKRGEGLECFKNKIDYYSKEDKNGKIPIEYLSETIKKTNELNRLKYLVKKYDKLKLPIVIVDEYK